MTFSSGEVLTAANLNALQDVTILTATSVVIAPATSVVIPFGSEVIDVANWHSTVTNTGRITVTNAGVYLLTANVVNIDAVSRLILEIKKNGSTIASTDVWPTGDAVDDASAAVHDLAAAGDYYEMAVYQNSGGNRTADHCTFGVSTIYVS
mgnify:CR=1 FL=1